MTLNDAVIDCPLTGTCPIDVDKAIKTFTEKCFISQYKDSYKLVRIRNKKAVALKVCINKGTADKLIFELGLVSHRSPVFSNARTYRLPTTT